MGFFDDFASLPYGIRMVLWVALFLLVWFLIGAAKLWFWEPELGAALERIGEKTPLLGYFFVVVACMCWPVMYPATRGLVFYGDRRKWW